MFLLLFFIMLPFVLSLLCFLPVLVLYYTYYIIHKYIVHKYIVHKYIVHKYFSTYLNCE